MEINIKEITIPTYYSEEDDGTIRIDEDSMRDEFERKLKDLLEETEKHNKNK